MLLSYGVFILPSALTVKPSGFLIEVHQVPTPKIEDKVRPSEGLLDSMDEPLQIH